MLKQKALFLLILIAFTSCNSLNTTAHASMGGVGVGNGKFESSYGFEIVYPASLNLTQKSPEDFSIDNSNLVTVGPISSIEFTILPGTYETLPDLLASIQTANPGVIFLPIQFSTGPGFYYLVRNPGHVIGHYYLRIENNRAVDAKLDAYSANNGISLVGSIVGLQSDSSGEPAAIEVVPNPEPSQFVVGAQYEWRTTYTSARDTTMDYQELSVLAVNGNLITVDYRTSEIEGAFTDLWHTVGVIDASTGKAVKVTSYGYDGKEIPNSDQNWQLPNFEYESLPAVMTRGIAHTTLGDIPYYQIGDASTMGPNEHFWNGSDPGPFRGCEIYSSNSDTMTNYSVVTELIHYAVKPF